MISFSKHFMINILLLFCFYIHSYMRICLYHSMCTCWLLLLDTFFISQQNRQTINHAKILKWNSKLLNVESKIHLLDAKYGYKTDKESIFRCLLSTEQRMQVERGSIISITLEEVKASQRFNICPLTSQRSIESEK